MSTRPINLTYKPRHRALPGITTPHGGDWDSAAECNGGEHTEDVACPRHEPDLYSALGAKHVTYFAGVQ